jgi:hypothetical protein
VRKTPDTTNLPVCLRRRRQQSPLGICRPPGPHPILFCRSPLHPKSR